jgi:3-hydroxyacyl-CoA dehydrogenase
MKRSELKKQIEEIITELLNEDTIDVSNPSSLTPQQKQAAINTARTKTKNPKLGTPENPVDFV